MSYRRKTLLSLAAALAFAGSAALAQPPEHRDSPRPEEHRDGQRPEDHGGGQRPQERGGQHPEHAPEPHPGPHGYERPHEPEGWNNRPHDVDRGAYQHNYQAQRSFHIGPYHRPRGWQDHHWAYGESLPRAYWAPEYIIGDYWLFALEVPPAGYEWVRDGNDALLINTGNGEILQVEYGVFS